MESVCQTKKEIPRCDTRIIIDKERGTSAHETRGGSLGIRGNRLQCISISINEASYFKIFSESVSFKIAEWTGRFLDLEIRTAF